jgi:hypothetical protein
MTPRRLVEVHRLLASGAPGGLVRSSMDRLGRVPLSSGLQRSVGPGSGAGQACVSAEAARHVLQMAEREFSTPVNHAYVLDFAGVERLGSDAAMVFIACKPIGLCTAENMSPAVKTVWERAWREVLA